MRIYKETLQKILEKKNTDQITLSEKMGYNKNYISQKWSRSVDHSYAEFNPAEVTAICMLFAIKKEDLSAVPKAKQKEEPPKKQDEQTSNAHITSVVNRLINNQDSIAEMLHADLYRIHEDLKALRAVWEPRPKVGGEHSK